MAANSGAGGPTLSEVKSTVMTTISSAISTVLAKAKEVTNTIMPPERWEELKKKVVDFARGHPLIASLAFGQILFSGIPLVTFVLLTVGVLIFSLVSALLVAVLGALLFTTFCVGVALLVLLPTLFVTTFMGVGVWMWGWGAYYLVKWYGNFDTEQLTRMTSGVTVGILGDRGKASKGEKQLEEYTSKSHSYENTNSGTTAQSKDNSQGSKQSKVESTPPANGKPDSNVKRQDKGDQQSTTQPKTNSKPESGPETGVTKKTGSVNINEVTKPVGDVKKRVDVGNVASPVKGVAGGLV